MKVSINLNDRARVKLTHRGCEVARKWLSGLKGSSPSILDLDHFGRPVDGHGTREFMLWELMQIFGPACVMGCEPVFEGNHVEVING